MSGVPNSTPSTFSTLLSFYFYFYSFLQFLFYSFSSFGHQNGATSIDALSRERAITSGGYDRTIRIWKIVEESQLIYNGHSGSVDVVKLINEENFLSCGDDGQLCVWGSLKKKPLCSVAEAHGKDESNGQPMWISSIATLLNTDLVASGEWSFTRFGYVFIFTFSTYCFLKLIFLFNFFLSSRLERRSRKTVEMW